MIGLHYWTASTKYAADDPMHANSPAVKEAVEDFINAGMLKRRDEPTEYGSEYEGTDALRVWVEALCDVRWPVQVWVVPDSRTSGTRS